MEEIQNRKSLQFWFQELTLLIFTCFIAGIIGDWKNHFPEALRERFDEHYKQQMKDCTVKFRMEL
jgi:hypothetical protein